MKLLKRILISVFLSLAVLHPCFSDTVEGYPDDYPEMLAVQNFLNSGRFVKIIFGPYRATEIYTKEDLKNLHYEIEPESLSIGSKWYIFKSYRIENDKDNNLVITKKKWEKRK